MKLTKVDKANVELVTLCKSVRVTKHDANGSMKKRMKSFQKLVSAGVFWACFNDDGSMTFEMA